MTDAVKSRVLPFVLCAVSLAVGVFAGIGAAGRHVRQSAEPVSVKEPESAKKAVSAEDANLRVLRARVRELERQLAEKNAVADAAKPDAEAVEERDERRRGPNGGDWRANVEKFRQEHPEEYAKMEEGRKSFMSRRQERTKSQIEFLSSVDTSKMSPEAKTNHERLLALMAERQEFESKITPEAVMNATDEERRAGWEKLMSSDCELRELKAKERDILLNQTASALGLSGQDAADVVETIHEIYDITSGGNGGFGGFGGGRGGRGGGNGGRGGRR